MKHFRSIDGLRAYMAWWVVTQHAIFLCGAYQNMPKLLAWFLTAGYLAVDVFIVISGFVIAHLLDAKQTTYREYIVRRGFRIYPIYIFAILLALLFHDQYMQVFSAGDWSVGIQERITRSQVEHANFIEYLSLHIVLLHGVLPDSLLPFISTAFLAPAWSLSLEWQFYVVAPWFVALSKNAMVRWVAIIVCIAATALISSGAVGRWDFASNIFCSLGYFSIGVATRKYIGGIRLSTLWPYFAIFAAMAIGDAYRAGLRVLHTEVLTLLIWGVTYVSILHENGAKARSQKWKRFLELLFRNKAATTLGTWSYSTYLVHVVIFSLIGAVLLDLGLWSARTSVYLCVIVSYPIIALCSYLLYRFIEAPGITAGRAVSKRLATE